MFKRTGSGSHSTPMQGFRPRPNAMGWRTCAALGAALIVSACTASSVLAPRPQVDVGTHTAAVSSSSASRSSTQAATAATQPLPTSETTVVASAPEPLPEPAPDAETGLAPGPRALGTLTMTSVDGQMSPVAASTSETMSAPETAIAMPEPEPELALEPEKPVQVAAMPAPAPRAPEPEPAPTSVGYPRLSTPAVAPRAAEPPVVKPVMPADERACRRALKKIGATFTDIPRIGNGGSCGIDWPVRVTSLSGNISMKPAAKLTCEMALTFAQWTKKELAPAARLRYLSGVKRINNGTYSCRRIAGSRTMSSHSKGNAIDIMSIELENGRNIDVRKPGFFAFRQRGLLNTVRADGCSYFTTVLGPGYNYDHRNHFHFDLMRRKSGHRACR